MHVSARPFLILQTGDNLPELAARRGEFPHLFRVAMRLPVHAVQVHDARLGGLETLNAGHFAGVLITGSSSMVTDREPWSEQTAAWLRAAHTDGVPMLGVCYGHQLLAHAFGGEVGYHPQGREIGSKAIALDATAAHDPLFQSLPGSFVAHTTHMQTVLKPPPSAAVLARSSHDNCQAFRFGSHAWGVQFHPEFSAETMRGYIQARRIAMQREGLDPIATWRAVQPTPKARHLLHRFVRFCRQSTLGS